MQYVRVLFTKQPTFIDNFVKTQQFKDCYNESEGIYYELPMYDSYIILANYTLNYIQNNISAIDKDIFEQWINSNTCIREIVNNIGIDTLIGACVNYANRVFKHIVLSYIKLHKCDGPC